VSGLRDAGLAAETATVETADQPPRRRVSLWILHGDAAAVVLGLVAFLFLTGAGAAGTEELAVPLGSGGIGALLGAVLSSMLTHRSRASAAEAAAEQAAQVARLEGQRAAHDAATAVISMLQQQLDHSSETVTKLQRQIETLQGELQAERRHSLRLDDQVHALERRSDTPVEGLDVADIDS
jgi:hypothetical protein